MRFFAYLRTVIAKNYSIVNPVFTRSDDFWSSQNDGDS